MAAPAINRLNQAELDFVNNQVTGAFLHQYGTSGGYGMFCKLATQQGFKCAGGAQSKGSYATYLKNAITGGGSLWARMVNDYNNLDGFTKASMAKGITKSKALKPPQPFQSGCFKNFTVNDLRDIADAAGVKVSGNKAQICGQLQKAGVSPAALWGQDSQTVQLSTPAAPGRGQVAWQQYARSTNKKRPRAPKTYASAKDYVPSAIPDIQGNLTIDEAQFMQSLDQQ